MEYVCERLFLYKKVSYILKGKDIKPVKLASRKIMLTRFSNGKSANVISVFLKMLVCRNLLVPENCLLCQYLFQNFEEKDLVIPVLWDPEQHSQSTGSAFSFSFKPSHDTSCKLWSFQNTSVPLYLNWKKKHCTDQGCCQNISILYKGQWNMLISPLAFSFIFIYNILFSIKTHYDISHIHIIFFRMPTPTQTTFFLDFF